ncbi:hypothetical protein [Cupriavidus sp. RAF20_2]|uniref:hypothetical protein n=1 Tax=Cupriavidus sp. RAF20_2 TaxID=3233053 RepID=UPI003F929D46
MVYFEEGGYCFWCIASKAESGQWEAVVNFQRKSDMNETRIPGMAHKIKAEFESEAQAIDAAQQYGHQTARRGDVGL